jgi:hypothetical protein
MGSFEMEQVDNSGAPQGGDMGAGGGDEAQAMPAAETMEAPVEEAPVEEAPVEDTSMDEAPAEDMPMEEMPADDMAMEEAPADDMAMEEMSAEDMSMEEMPADDMAMEEMPADDMAMEEAPAEDMSMEEMPADDMAVDEPPMDDTSMQDVPMDDMSMADAPVDDGTMGDVQDTDEFAADQNLEAEGPVTSDADLSSEALEEDQAGGQVAPAANNSTAQLATVGADETADATVPFERGEGFEETAEDATNDALGASQERFGQLAKDANDSGDFDSISQAVSGRDFADLNDEEQTTLKKVLTDISMEQSALNGAVASTATADEIADGDASDDGVVLSDNVNAAFIPGEDGEQGTAAFSERLFNEDGTPIDENALAKAANEEVGESIGERLKSAKTLVAEGDLGARLRSLVNEGGTAATLKDTPDLFEASTNDRTDALVNGDTVNAAAQTKDTSELEAPTGGRPAGAVTTRIYGSALYPEAYGRVTFHEHTESTGGRGKYSTSFVLDNSGKDKSPKDFEITLDADVPFRWGAATIEIDNKNIPDAKAIIATDKPNKTVVRPKPVVHNGDVKDSEARPGEYSWGSAVNPGRIDVRVELTKKGRERIARMAGGDPANTGLKTSSRNKDFVDGKS